MSICVFISIIIFVLMIYAKNAFRNPKEGIAIFQRSIKIWDTSQIHSSL